MKALIISSVFSFFTLPFLISDSNNDVSTNSGPDTYIVQCIDGCVYVDHIDDGYDCTIILDENGDFLDAKGPDC